MKILLTAFAIILSIPIFGQSKPVYYKAFKAKFKKVSETSYSGPFECNDIILINSTTGEITMLSESCKVYRITGSELKKLDDSENYFELKAQDRNNNTVRFDIYDELVNGKKESRILMIDEQKMMWVYDVELKNVF